MKLYLYGFVALLLVGMTWALHWQVKQNGVLTVRVDAALEQAKQNAKDRDEWKAHAADLSKLSKSFADVSNALDKRMQASDQLVATAQRSFKDALKSDPKAADVLRVRAPDSIIRVLCDAGRYDQSAAAVLCGTASTEHPVPEVR